MDSRRWCRNSFGLPRSQWSVTTIAAHASYCRGWNRPGSGLWVGTLVLTTTTRAHSAFHKHRRSCDFELFVQRADDAGDRQ